MKWAAKGAQIWREWDLHGPAPFHSCGVIYLLAPENTAAALTAIAEHSVPSYPIEVLKGREIIRVFPDLALKSRPLETSIALYEPKGGYCNPRLAARLYGESIRCFGGTVIEGVKVETVHSTDTGVRVATATGGLKGRVAVIASGAASSALMPLPTFSRTIPLSCFGTASDWVSYCLIDEVTGGYLRPEPPCHVYCGGANQVDLVDLDDIPEFQPALHRRHQKNIEILLGEDVGEPLSGLMGYDSYTLDFLPLLGFRDEHPRICLATGFSGRGAKYIPAVAEVLTAEILERMRQLA